MWKVISLFAILFGLLFWGFYQQQYNHKVNNNKKFKIAAPSISQIEKDAAKNGIQIGSIAPDFQLENVDGKKTKLSDYKGEKVILNFWATWCSPCKSEMPYIEKYYENTKNKNVVVLAINLTNLEKNKNNVQQFINEYHLTFPVLLDSGGNVAKLYQNIAIPTTFIIDKTGRIAQKIVGPMKKGALVSLISKTK